MNNADRKPWWKGARGEWLVVTQVCLGILLFFGPRTVFGQPSWPFPFPGACRVAGVLLMVMGGGLFLAAVIKLGPALTPLPYPKEDARLVETGPYALVRHPIYSGGIILSLGWALFVQGWLTLGYVVVLFIFLDRKSKLEEKWLAEKFSNYGDYQRHVRKLIPFIY